MLRTDSKGIARAESEGSARASRWVYFIVGALSESAKTFTREFQRPLVVVALTAMLILVSSAPSAGAEEEIVKWRVDEARAVWTIEAHGYYAVRGLKQDPKGIWSARAWQYGRLSIVQVDQQGNFDVMGPPIPDLRSSPEVAMPP